MAKKEKQIKEKSKPKKVKDQPKSKKNNSKPKKQNKTGRDVAKNIQHSKTFRPGPFSWVHMWITYVASMLMKDQRRIPDNIGNKILITNNMYVTANYMNVIIQIIDLGDKAPITYCGEVLKRLRDRGNTCIVDFSFKNRDWIYKSDDAGLQSRIRIWENNVNDPTVTGRRKSQAARCLYTVQQAQSGKQLKETRLYVTLRSKDVQELVDAEAILDRAISEFNGTYDSHYARVKEDLEFTSILGDSHDDIKSVPAVMTSNSVMSQMIPNCGSFNDWKGYYLGQNVENGTPYYIDFGSITLARNLYVVAPSGVGKTVIAANLMQSAFENGAAVCTMDIKGNEYVNFIRSTGGYIVSLRPTSYEYINSFAMHKEDAYRDNAEMYFNSRFNFSKQQIMILSGITDKTQLTSLETLLDEFLDNLYVFYGAEKRNRNSWDKTLELNPYVVFDALKDFLTPSKMAQYCLPKTLITTLSMYMSRTGSKSYVFTSEFDFDSIIKSPTLSFDFGILTTMTVSDVDIDLFRLKLLYMSKLNADFTTANFNRGIRTLKILEESQIVNDDILHMYSQEYTLSRARKQDTVLLGNSVQALVDNPASKSIVENTTCLLVGPLITKARNKVINEFSLEHLEHQLMLPGSEPKYKNSFVLINMMQSKTLYPIVKVQLDENKSYKMYTPSKEDSVYDIESNN